MDGWSLFVKPQYPVTEDFNIYALLGFGGVNIDSVTTEIVDVDDTSFQWGLGASYDITESIAIFADYTNLANDMDGYFYTSTDLTQVDVDTFNVGLTYKF
jgi:opacity protein-like surface antigen